VVEILGECAYFHDVDADPKEVTMNNATEKTIILTPTAGSVYSFGWARIKKYFLDLFLITIIVAAVYVPLAMIQSLDGSDTPGGVLLRMFSFAYLVLLLMPLDFGAALVFLKTVRNEKFDVQDMFSVFEDYLNVVLAGLLVAAIVGIGIMLLVVPGIIFACRLAFVRYLVMDRKMEPVEAVKESWRMTGGHANQIFLTGFLAVWVAIAGLLCLGVGVIVSWMWIRCGFASMYYAVSELERSKSSPPAPAAEATPAG
jgi:uncharacterized membrane protein